MISLEPLDREGIAWAQVAVTNNHYLHKPVDTRCSVEGYRIIHKQLGRIGVLLFGRPQATRCRDWYGKIEMYRAGIVEVTNWQVLNLARVWLDPGVQRGGLHFLPGLVPGFFDRRGDYQSTLASAVLNLAVEQIGFDYLIRRPPCFLDEPYQIKWLLSYCNTHLHKGIIYAAAGFELYATNAEGIQTWRKRLPWLSAEQDFKVREASRINPRSNRFRAQRAQLQLEI
jgi:hypothetical protein